MKINLGDTVKDPVTGIKGIAYVRCSYLQGCDRIGIQEPVIKEKGKESIVPELFHVDEPQLDLVKRSTLKKTTAKKPGGPSSFMKDTKRR